MSFLCWDDWRSDARSCSERYCRTGEQVIGNPCEKCQKLLKAGCIGFLSPSGEGLILQEDKGKEIMKKLGVGSFYVEDAMTIVRVRQQFWERQFKEIVDRRERIKEGREKKRSPRRTPLIKEILTRFKRVMKRLSHI